MPTWFLCKAHKDAGTSANPKGGRNCKLGAGEKCSNEVERGSEAGNTSTHSVSEMECKQPKAAVSLCVRVPVCVSVSYQPVSAP